MLPPERPDRIYAAFDDHRLMANAGLILPVTLAHHLGLGELTGHHIDLPEAPGRAQAGDKLLMLLAGEGCRLTANARAPQTTSWSQPDFRHVEHRNALNQPQVA